MVRCVQPFTSFFIAWVFSHLVNWSRTVYSILDFGNMLLHSQFSFLNASDSLFSTFSLRCNKQTHPLSFLPGRCASIQTFSGICSPSCLHASGRKQPSSGPAPTACAYTGTTYRTAPSPVCLSWVVQICFLAESKTLNRHTWSARIAHERTMSRQHGAHDVMSTTGLFLEGHLYESRSVITSCCLSAALK